MENNAVTILLDTSNTSLNVAIYSEDSFISSISYEAWQKQSELLIPELNKLLDNHHLDKKDIKDVMVCIGPGSYTGVRIAVTVAKIIAVALDVKIYGLSSLHVLKDDDKPSICLINARSGRSYFGVYQGQEVVEEDRILTNEQVKEYIKTHPGYSICGDVSYLGLQGIHSDIFIQMISLKDEKFKMEPLSVKPVYLKD